MKKSLAIAALIAVGGGAASAAAATLPHFLGSDTLYQVTGDAITACGAPANTLVYDGTGSGNGESAMVHGTQEIAPMSRFLGSNICAVSGGLSELQTAQGLVIGLDGVSVVGSKATATAGGSTACNGTNSTTCVPESTGIAFAGSVTTTSNLHPSYTYTFTSWKDVLSIIYGGQSNASQNTATGDSGCNSDIRHTLANNWGSLFANPSCGSGACTILQHAFRRDDGSGTSDIFQQLVGLGPGPTSAANRSFGATPYCNANEVQVSAATNIPNPTFSIDAGTINAPGSGPCLTTTTGFPACTRSDGVTAGKCFVTGTPAAATCAPAAINIKTTITHNLATGAAVTIVGVGRNIDNTQIAGPPTGQIAANGNNQSVTVVDGLNFWIGKDGTANGSAVGSYSQVLLPPPAGLITSPIPTDYRELDPIRRPCASGLTAKEDVCNRDGNLGLVLAIVPTDFLGSIAAQYPTTTCVATNFSVAGTTVTDPNTGFAVKVACPNGEPQHGGNLCVMPVDSAGNTNCLNGTGNVPFAFNPAAVNGIAPGAADARVYNSHLLTGLAATATYQADTFGRSIVGSWYRLHSAHTLAGASGVKCLQSDATLQIGCLVQASPCSIGYGGRTADQWDSALTNPGSTVALKVNQVLPLAACVQSFDYALSRKLYLDTIVGWNNVVATNAAFGPAELDLAQCEASEAFIGPIMTNRNFINFAAGSPPNSGNPFAEDFNETMICTSQAPAATTANTVAPTGNTTPIPSAGTVCGNGILEQYEDCDDGTFGATGSPNTYTPFNGGNGHGSTAWPCSTTCRWSGPAAPIDPGTLPCTSVTPAGTACTRSDGTTAGHCYLYGQAQLPTCLP